MIVPLSEDRNNQKFSVVPDAESIFVPLAKGLDIDSIRCVKHTRKTDAAVTNGKPSGGYNLSLKLLYELFLEKQQAAS